MDGWGKNIIYAYKIHVGYTVQLKAHHFGLAVYAECKNENRECAMKCVRYYSNSMLDVAFPFYDVN